jgi:hypothetical protein
MAYFSTAVLPCRILQGNLFFVKRMIRHLSLLVIILAFHSAGAQIRDRAEEERRLYAQSKQVNQFFRRFNGEEDEKGNRYYPRDKQYRNVKLRKKYLDILFDESSPGISSNVKLDFAKAVLDNPDKSILDFHGTNWFSEVRATFTINGKDQLITLFMELEKDHGGYKWVINRVRADMYEPYFARDTTKVGRFLHPMSHELDFMNLRKAFDNLDSISQFTIKRFQPDHLSLFLYDIKKGTLSFKSVELVKFHFFQIEGWYFELSQFNRSGYNTGWLISNLVKLNNTNEREMLRKFLYK